MRIWEHTFEELTGGLSPHPDHDVPIARQPFISEGVVPITHNPRFGTAPIRIPNAPLFANQALLELKDGQWTFAGSYVGDTIQIESSVRGQGLAQELLLRCAEHRSESPPLSTNFTESGYKLLKRTHQLAIKRALEAKLTVPEAVLANYPANNNS